MNDINKYIDCLEGKGKRHVLLIVTPRGSYPNQFSHSEYDGIESAILENPKSYISLFEEDEDEIMQYAAFRLYIKPVICDKYQLYDKSTLKLKRMKEKEIESFIITKHFYNTVPSSKENEEEAIRNGIKKAEDFKNKFPIENFEFATVELGKDSNEANVFIDLDFTNKNNNIHFDYIYVY
ncbi:hypothetical protein [Paraliobacillus zengyii]|uniref:hypothetical protein n=1 Tax=Paraliobacillus zengyii TaxID=2213194 RepID=UPI000DD46913|nr:hypothetical protein [Paraliobacillus zengyii]